MRTFDKRHLRRRRKGLKQGTWFALVLLILFTSPLFFIFHKQAGADDLGEKPEVTDVSIVSPSPVAIPVANTPTPGVEVRTTPGQEEIEGYIRTIFGKEWRVARAVHYNECGPRNPNYPNCVYVTPREYSCGLYQINLRAHSNKVPVGETLEEKCEFLLNPYNNVLVAKSIWGDSGWNPWSAFTNGSYLKDL